MSHETWKWCTENQHEKNKLSNYYFGEKKFHYLRLSFFINNYKGPVFCFHVAFCQIDLCFSECQSADFLVSLSMLEKERAIEPELNREELRVFFFLIFCYYKFKTQNWHPGWNDYCRRHGHRSNKIRAPHRWYKTSP